MAYQSTGMMALFPVYLQRLANRNTPQDDYDNAVAQNEVNLNQNLEEIKRKILEIEAYLAQSNE